MLGIRRLTLLLARCWTDCRFVPYIGEVL